MSKSDTYLVPIDFSRGSQQALDYALKLARQRKGKVIALHVIPTEIVYTPVAGRLDLYSLMERDAQESFRLLSKRKRLKPEDCRFESVRAANFAEAIARRAKKLGATMIVMGSHGRTGLQRFVLGSVAERTIRYADCPVLIVKK
ncbi:MAG TPA: universal stress protein [Candidatus Acidoferrales bacterium]|nr:universal stress protein [Candidatus Acidoferrales bacterium]